MILNVSFKETDKRINAEFKETYRVSDGDVEAAYTKGYTQGFKDAQPTETINITANGIYDMTPVKTAYVDVPIPEGYLLPEGTFAADVEGSYDVTPYAEAVFTVQKEQISVIPTEETQTLIPTENKFFDQVIVEPIPEAYLIPEGTLEVSIEGVYDVTSYASVKFDVETEEITTTPTEEIQTFIPSENKFIDKVVVNPIPSEYLVPSGNIDITNTEEYDVTQYSTAQIKDENLKPEHIAENVEILGIKGTFYGGVDTRDGTATSDDLLAGKIAYSNEQRLVGTIEDYDGSNSEGIEVENKLRQIFDKSVVRIESQDLTGATEIYPRFLKDCVNLESIEFVDTIKTIGEDAVRNCPVLKEIVLPNSVTTLGANAFRGANNAIKLKLSSNCSVIPTYCFANLDALKTLTIPKGVTSLGAFAFYNCDVLEEIHWASSIASVYQDAFDFCKNVKRLYLTNLEAYFKVDFTDLNAQPIAASPQDGTTQVYLNDELITHLITPNGTTSIPKYAIYN